MSPDRKTDQDARLLEFLDDLKIEVFIEKLDTLKGVFGRSKTGGLRFIFTEELSDDEKVQFLMRGLSHLILGHVDEPLKIVPFFADEGQLTGRESLIQEHAQVLSDALLLGEIDSLWATRVDFQVMYGDKKAYAQTISDDLMEILG